MFESAQLENRLDSAKRCLAFLISIVFHAVGITVVVVLPLVFFNVLPAGELLTFLTAPPPPPAPPPPAPPVQVAVARSPVLFQRIEHYPTAIPNVIAPPLDEPPIPEYSAVQIPSPAGVLGSPAGSQGGRGVAIILDKVEPPPPAPPPARPRSPVPVGGNVLASRVVHRIEPEYPEIARRARISGAVVLHVLIDEEGSVADLKVLSGHPLLREAAVRAVSQWKYSPTLLNGEPVPVSGTVTIDFKLSR